MVLVEHESPFFGILREGFNFFHQITVHGNTEIVGSWILPSFFVNYFLGLHHHLDLPFAIIVANVETCKPQIVSFQQSGVETQVVASHIFAVLPVGRDVVSLPI